MTGKVYLVRSTSQEEGLMTAKGQEIVEQSDVILYDELANSSLLDYAKEGTEFFQVRGNNEGNSHQNQRKINNLLTTKARNGKIVTRLKFGDPFIFVREGNEAQQLAEENIEFEIISGAASLTIMTNCPKFYISLISFDLELAITILLLFLLATEFL